MNRNVASLVLTLFSLSMSFPTVEAQTFASHGEAGRKQPPAEEPFIDTSPSSLSKSFDDFNSSLETTGNHMRKDYEDSLAAAAKKRELEDLANQTDTNTALNGAFQNTQAQALNSGGLYNTPSVGTGTGGYPVVGGFAAPHIQGRYYSSAPRPSSAVIYRGGGARRR